MLFIANCPLFFHKHFQLQSWNSEIKDALNTTLHVFLLTSQTTKGRKKEGREEREGRQTETNREEGSRVLFQTLVSC